MRGSNWVGRVEFETAFERERSGVAKGGEEVQRARFSRRQPIERAHITRRTGATWCNDRAPHRGRHHRGDQSSAIFGLRQLHVEPGFRCTRRQRASGQYSWLSGGGGPERSATVCGVDASTLADDLCALVAKESSDSPQAKGTATLHFVSLEVFWRNCGAIGT